MTIHLHHLHGCTPTPLAHYLKAIGILRLVAQQRDAEARGFWRDQHFGLLTILDQSALEKFFLEEYTPTPFISPWNKGSGFYITDYKKGGSSSGGETKSKSSDSGSGSKPAESKSTPSKSDGK